MPILGVARGPSGPSGVGIAELTPAMSNSPGIFKNSGESTRGACDNAPCAERPTNNNIMIRFGSTVGSLQRFVLLIARHLVKLGLAGMLDYTSKEYSSFMAIAECMQPNVQSLVDMTMVNAPIGRVRHLPVASYTMFSHQLLKNSTRHRHNV